MQMKNRPRLLQRGSNVCTGEITVSSCPEMPLNVHSSLLRFRYECSV